MEDDSYFHFQPFPFKSFKVNDFITLRLEGNRTNIYVKGQLFQQCIYLLVNIPLKNIRKYDNIESIDEAEGKLSRKMEGDHTIVKPETEFWGHCSNIQAWVDNEYDTRILHRNLAFPLLRKLVEVGDPIAKKRFKEEIAKRLLSKHPPVIFDLLERGYLNYLGKEELLFLFNEFNRNKKVIRDHFRKYKISYINSFETPILRTLIAQGYTQLIDSHFKKLIVGYKRLAPQALEWLARMDRLDLLKKENLNKIFMKLKFLFKDYKYYLSDDILFGLLNLFTEAEMKEAQELVSNEIACRHRGSVRTLKRMIRIRPLQQLTPDALEDLIRRQSNKYELNELIEEISKEPHNVYVVNTLKNVYLNWNITSISFRKQSY